MPRATNSVARNRRKKKVLKEARGQFGARSKLYRTSFLYRVVRDRQDRKAVADYYTQSFQDSYFGDDDQTAEWQRAQENLILIRDLARERSVQAALVIFPILVELDDEYPFQAICDLVDAFGRSAGLPVHNLLPAFVGRRGPDLWLDPRDQHPNELGHALAAQSLLPFVSKLLREQAHQ